ncbi:MAG: helix-turn-helix domain-containing protein [Nanoarchaeota archaeon]
MGTCHLFNVLDILGKKWTLFLLQEIMLPEENGFNDMVRNIPGISPKILSERLSKLEEEKLIEKKILKQTRTTRYYLTEKGRDLMAVIQSLKEYNMKHANKTVNCTGIQECITCSVLQEETIMK